MASQSQSVSAEPTTSSAVEPLLPTNESPDPTGKNAKESPGGASPTDETGEDDSNPQAESPSAAQAMDEALWGNLPEHLLDTILASLPVATFLRLRTVCKKWSTAIASKTFLQSCSAIRSRPPYLLMFADHFHRRVAAIYDVDLQKWHLLPFSNFLQCRFPESFLVLAAGGGLLCLEGTGSKSGSMFISNPVTKRWRKLPKMIPMRSPYVVGMIADEELHSYKVLVAQDGETLASQLYDSESDRWEMNSVFRKQTAIVAGATPYRGLLYCLTMSPTGLLTFDPSSGRWDEVKVQLPGSLTCPSLMNRKGKLLLVGGIEEFGSLTRLCIWELNPSRPPQWIEVLQLPEDVFKQLFSSSSGHFICVGYGDFVCLHEYYSREILLVDIEKKSWSWLPSCLLNDYIEARSVLGLAFQPRIDAVP